MSDDSYNDDKTLSANLMVGRKVLHYTIISTIGSGGMGQVFLAQDTRLDRLVALKTLQAKLSTAPEFRQRFITEAKASARLSHPNICSIYAIEEVEDNIFIAMEYVQGTTLRDIAHDEVLEFDRIYDIAIQCCEGLQAAHDENIIHRDIKSSNIMLDKWGRVKIMDFGLAKLTDDDSATATSGITGTYQYMSPEQVTGKPLDYRTDIYSMAVVFYELITSQLPYSGDNVASIAYGIVHSQVPPMSSIRKDVPSELQTIIDKALQKDLSARYQTVAEILTDLRAPKHVAPIEPTAPVPGQATVAVFPFRNLSPDPDNQYLSDGICEEVITALARVQGINVASRAAVSRFKGDEYDPVEISEKLKVSTFLEGSIRRFGDDVRINAQMIRVSDGFVVWSNVFDRKLTDIFTLQSDIAEKIVGALNVQLTSDEAEVIARKPTVNPDAYDLYLRGKYHLKHRDKTSVKAAIDLLSEAVKLDEGFAAAHGELAVAFGVYANYGFDSSEDMASLAKKTAEKAVELDPSSSQAHMAMFFLTRHVNIRKAISELRTAIALDPSNFEAHHYLAHCYVFHGRYMAAEKAELMALRLDPLQEISEAHLCRIYYYLGQETKLQQRVHQFSQKYPDSYLTHTTHGWISWFRREWEEAENHFTKAMAIEPNNERVIDYLTDCFRRQDKYDQSKDLLNNGLQKNPNSELLVVRQAQILAKTGEQEKSRELFKKMRDLWVKEGKRVYGGDTATYNFNMAWLTSLEEDVDTAVNYIERAVELDYGHFAELKTRPDFDSLRENKEFIKLLANLEKEKSTAEETFI